MAIKVVTAKAHEAQLKDQDILREIESVEEALSRTHLEYIDNSINFIFIKGIYNHFERRMITACLFVNKMDRPIRELHGILRMKYRGKEAQIAKTTIDFDENFMGVIHPDEGLLVHLGIPVKGLQMNENFENSDVMVSFSEVRITPC